MRRNPIASILLIVMLLAAHLPALAFTPYCELVGSPLGYDGQTLQPGTTLSVFRVQSTIGSVIPSQKKSYVFKNDGTWFPALRFEKSAIVWLYLNAPGFDADHTNGSPFNIPNSDTATLASLAHALSVPQQVAVAYPEVNVTLSLADNVESVLQYSDLPTALANIGPKVTTLVVSTQIAISDNLTIPANVTLHFTGIGWISVASGKTLTINGPLQAPPRQIFSGSGSVRLGAHVECSYPQWFGAKMDGSTDDSAAAQKAIDAWKQASNAPTAGTVMITGPMAIGSTLNLFDNPVVLKGKGAFGSGGYAGDPRNNFIKWTGSAGNPMVLIHSLGARVESLHFIGKSSAKPSAAIEISESGSYFADMTCVRDCWVGPMYGWDDDTGIQFTRGIHFSGGLDSDTNLLQRVFITNCVTGIDIASGNASVDHFDTIQTAGCTTGLKTVAPQVVITNWICASNDVDLDMASQGVYVELYNYTSEGSGRMAVGSSLAPYKLIVRGGGFQADPAGKFTPADFSGKRAFIQFKGLAGAATYIDLHDFNLSSNGTPATPIIQAWGTLDNVIGATATAVHIKVEACPGILTSTIDVGNDGYSNSSRIVEYTAFPAGQVQAQQTRFVQNSRYGSEDSAFQDGRFDLLGKVNVYGGPLRVKKLADLSAFTTSVTPTGTGATSYSYKVVPLTYDGHGAPSVAATCTNGTLGSGGRVNTLAWHPVPGAYAFQIYGRTAGSEQLMATVTMSDIQKANGTAWVDNGSITPSGALPSGNTTGNLSVDGFINGGKGADVASASTITPTGNVFTITGTTTISTISATGINPGTVLYMITASALTFDETGNIDVTGATSLTTSANYMAIAAWDGTKWRLR